MAEGRTPGTKLKETRHKNTYIDKKINESITALLNNMTVLVDNATDEDVTLPEMMDRLYKRVAANEQAIEGIIEGGGITPGPCNNIKFYDNIAKFPSVGEDDVVYVDKSGGGMYRFDLNLGSYVPAMNMEPYTLSTERINEFVTAVNGGTATGFEGA